MQLRAYSAYQSKSAINPTLLLVRSKEIEQCDLGKVEVSSPSSLKVMRFCLDDDEDWKKRDRRRETMETSETPSVGSSLQQLSDRRERRVENLTLLETKARKKKRRTNAFSLSNSRSLAKEKITTGGALVRVRAFCAKVSKL